MQLCPLLYICKHQHLPAREQTHFQLLYEEPLQYCLYQDDRTSEGILLPTAHVFNLLIRSNILAIQNIFFQKLQFFF